MPVPAGPLMKMTPEGRWVRVDQEDAKGLFGALFDFSFRHFITGRIIRFLYMLSVGLAGLMYLFFVIGAFQMSAGFGAVMLLIVGPLVFLLSVIYARVLLEIIMVVFRISEDTTNLSRSVAQMARNAAVNEEQEA